MTNYTEIVENVARAWASMDGKLEKFEICKADPDIDLTDGYYMGYIADAKELLKRSGLETLIKETQNA